MKKIEEWENYLFIKELGNLFTEYYHCPDKEIKKLIVQDIILLGSVINT